MQYLKKLFLNLVIITLDVLLILVSVKAFTHKLSPIIGVISVVGILTTFFLLITQVQNKHLRYRRPGMFKTTLVVILIAIIASFAGCQPLASYKDKAFDYISNLMASPNTNTITITNNITASTAPTIIPTITPTPTEETTKIAKPSLDNISEQELKENPELQKIIDDKKTEEAKRIADRIAQEEQQLISIEKQTFTFINTRRIVAGLRPITWNENLHNGARKWSETMQSEGILHHDINGVYTYYFAECCYGASYSGYRTPEQTVDAWMNSSGHRAILMGAYSIGAIGIAKDSGFWATYRCQ